jgi:hypothetical protein
MIGDGHAAQGDGEIMGAAIETSFDVQFTGSGPAPGLSAATMSPTTARNS